MSAAQTLTRLADGIDRLTTRIGHTAAWAVLLIVLVEMAVVLLRYLLATGSVWLQESVIYAHATLFMLTAALTLKADRHVRVDIFYARASPRRRALIDVIGTLVFLLPVCAALFWLSLPYVGRSIAILERSREASGLPLVFLLKALIPIFALLLGLQGVAQLIRATGTLANRDGATTVP